MTEGDTHLLSTIKNRPGEEKTTPSPILSVEGFPATARKFFHRNIYFNEWTTRTVVQLKNSVLMKESVVQVRTKLLDWLKTKKLWMKNGDLDSVETSTIGWML